MIDGQRRAAQQTMSGGEWLGAARTSTNWRCCRCAEARGGEGGEACMRECVYVFFLYRVIVIVVVHYLLIVIVIIITIINIYGYS